MRELERQVVLSVLDRKWREHLYEMDYLQEGIQLRSYGQRDPLVEYQREGFTMFTTMMDAIKEESVQLLFNLEVQVAAPEEPPATSTAEEEQTTPDAEVPGVARACAQDRGAGSRGCRRRRARRAASGGSGFAGSTRARRACSTPRPPSTATRAASRRWCRGGRSQRPPVQKRTLMYEGTPRNAKCPCGSGRTYKRCHGDPRSAG